MSEFFRLVDWYDGYEDEVCVSNSAKRIIHEYDKRVEDTDGECNLAIYDDQGTELHLFEDVRE